jgi:hypothetical protein
MFLSRIYELQDDTSYTKVQPLARLDTVYQYSRWQITTIGCVIFAALGGGGGGEQGQCVLGSVDRVESSL